MGMLVTLCMLSTSLTVLFQAGMQKIQLDWRKTLDTLGVSSRAKHQDMLWYEELYFPGETEVNRARVVSKLNMVYFAFFVKREAVLRMTAFISWEKMPADDFVVVPLHPIMFPPREDSRVVFFSHCWYQRDHPDPANKDLEFLQRYLNQTSSAQLVWVDFCCLPQGSSETLSPDDWHYKKLTFQKMPGLIKVCTFTFQYDKNDKRHRAWIFFELALNWLLTGQITCTDGNRKYIVMILKYLVNCHEVTLHDFFGRSNIKTAGESKEVLQFLTSLLTISFTFYFKGEALHDIISNFVNCYSVDFYKPGTLYVHSLIGYSPLKVECSTGRTTYDGRPFPIDGKGLLKDLKECLNR